MDYAVNDCGARGLVVGTELMPLVEGIRERIARGDIYQANLTFQAEVATAEQRGRRPGPVVMRLSALARALFWALIGLIVFGIVTIFVQIPNGALIYAILGLVIFAGLTAFDFQRLRRSQDIRTAPLLAASIFLDILNVFLLLLSLFGGSRD